MSLLSNLSKVLERCIYNYVYPITKDLIHSSQHGFLNKHSTVTNLLEFYNDIYLKLNNGNQVDVIYLDLSKAFDCVPHALLIAKLKCMD